jgi:hypothetical protein
MCASMASCSACVFAPLMLSTCLPAFHWTGCGRGERERICCAFRLTQVRKVMAHEMEGWQRSDALAAHELVSSGAAVAHHLKVWGGNKIRLDGAYDPGLCEAR